MWKFFTWIFCLLVIVAGIGVTAIHAITHAFDGSHFLLTIGLAIVLTIIATEGDAGN